jgi:hypothetical protein
MPFSSPIIQLSEESDTTETRALLPPVLATAPTLLGESDMPDDNCENVITALIAPSGDTMFSEVLFG